MAKIKFYMDEHVSKAVAKDASRRGVKLTARRKTMLQMALAGRDEAAAPIIRKIHLVKPDPIRGLVEAAVDGQRRVVEYEPDGELRDTEQVPLLDAGGIEGFLRREVLPYAPDAWYNPGSVRTGYEISFTRYFYKPQPLGSLAEIRADILVLEQETEGLLTEILRAERGPTDESI